MKLAEEVKELQCSVREELGKRRRVESEISELQNTIKNQSKRISKLRSGQSEKSRSSSKSWLQYSRQQRYNKQKKILNDVKSALSFCEYEKFRPCTIKLENTDTGNHSVLDLTNGTFSSMSKIFQMKLFMN